MRRGVVTWRTELKIRKMAEVQKGLDKGDKERRGKERRVRSSTEAEGQRGKRSRRETDSPEERLRHSSH